MSTLTNAPFHFSTTLLGRIEVAYGVPPRSYHSWAHIEAVFRQFDLVAAGPGWRQPVEVASAMLFHDIVYDASKRDNEAKSAHLARAWLTEEFATRPDPVDLERVSSLIMLTARHGSFSPGDFVADPDAAHFLDADMAILGAPDREFDFYDQNVAREYTPHVNSFLYGILRRRFLSKLLDAERIYLSDFFHARLDQPARANLRRALDRLP